MQNSKIFPGTIPWGPPFYGRGKFVFVLRKCIKTLYSNAEFKNFPGDNTMWTPVLGERKVCFRSLKMYQNFPTAMQNSKKNPGKNPGVDPRNPVSGKRR